MYQCSKSRSVGSVCFFPDPQTNPLVRGTDPRIRRSASDSVSKCQESPTRDRNWPWAWLWWPWVGGRSSAWPWVGRACRCLWAWPRGTAASSHSRRGCGPPRPPARCESTRCLPAQKTEWNFFPKYLAFCAKVPDTARKHNLWPPLLVCRWGYPESALNWTSKLSVREVNSCLRKDLDSLCDTASCPRYILTRVPFTGQLLCPTWAIKCKKCCCGPRGKMVQFLYDSGVQRASLLTLVINKNKKQCFYNSPNKK